MPRTPKPVVTWAISGPAEDPTRVVLDDGVIAVFMPSQSSIGDYASTLLYQALTAARRARRSGVLNLPK